jgi:hypothetical protein
MELTRAFWTRPCSLGSNSPAALDGTASSAARMNGITRDFTASMSCHHVSVVLRGLNKAHLSTYMFDLVCPVQGFGPVDLVSSVNPVHVDLTISMSLFAAMSMNSEES